MKTRFFIVLILFSILAKSQNDTVVYYSILNKAITSKQNALYSSEVKKNKKGAITLTNYSLRDNEWIKGYEAAIQKESDSSFVYFQIKNPKKKYTRVFFKTNSGFKIRDYSNNILIEEGLSTNIFPLIKQGPWLQYNEQNGNLKIDAIYSNNQIITSKFYISGGSFINDVFIYCEKPPSYEGGDSELLKFISENTIYPEKAKDKNITGRVIVYFVLMKDGSIQGLELFQKAQDILDLEAIRVVNSIPKGKWQPAEINGEKVNSPMLIPISFNLIR